MPVLSAKEFYSTYVHSLEHDFQTNGVPASWFPEHPKQWGSELTRIQFLAPSPLKWHDIALSDDDSVLAIAIEANVYIYAVERSGPNGDEVNLNQKRILRSGHGGGDVSAVEFQPGSHEILLSCGSILENNASGRRMKSTVRVWDMKQEEEEDGIAPAAEGAANLASQLLSQRNSLWSQGDSQNIDIARGFEGVLLAAQMKVEIENGVLLQGSTKRNCFSHDGSFILVFPPEDRLFVVKVVAVNGFQERCQLKGHSDYVAWAEFSPDDSVIATSSWDKTVCIWNAVNGNVIHTLTGATNQSWGAAFSPDGKLIGAGAGDGQVRVWDVRTGEILHTLDGYKGWVRNLCFSPDGKTLAAGAAGASLRIFDISTGECLQHWKTDTNHFLEVTSVQYTIQGLLVFKTPDGRKFTFDPKTNQKGQFEHGPEVIGSMGARNCVVSSDGTLLFTIDFDGSVRVWRL